MITQSEYIRQFNETSRPNFNPMLFKRDNMDIVDAISKIIKSCERNKYFTLKVLNIKVIDNYEDIYNKLRDHEERKRKISNKDDNPYDFMYINDSDIMLMEVKYLVRHNGSEKQKINGKMVDVENPEELLTVLIAIPRFVNKYYFRINGNYYNTIFQIVDGSTYNNSSATNSKYDIVSFKTCFQPIRIYRKFVNMTNLNTGAVDSNILYTAMIFKSMCPAMLYILAANGLIPTFDFLGIYNVRVSEDPINEEGWNCYNIHNVYIAYPSDCTDSMVQCLVSTIYTSIKSETTVEDLFNQKFWLTKLGEYFKNVSVEKGLFVLDSVESIYDEVTKANLHLPEAQKENIYMILRWLMREFPALRAKDNTDVSTKRLRIADYIAQIYATKLSTGIHRASDLGRKVTLKNIIKAIYTSPMFLIKEICKMDNLIDYADMVNDNDATIPLKFTYKGIAGLGDNGSIQPMYRHVDPSHIGILDLDVSSVSDPGMSGMLCPTTTVYPDGSFTNYNEPNSWESENSEYQNRFKGTFYEIPEDFDREKAIEDISKSELNITILRCPIYNPFNLSEDFSAASSKLKRMEEEEQAKSIFDNIIMEEDDDN